MTNLNLLIEILESKFYSTLLCFSIFFFYMSSFVSFSNLICLMFDTKHPLAPNSFLSFEQGNKTPCLVFLQCLYFYNYSLSPLWFWNSYLDVVCKGPVWMKVGVQKLRFCSRLSISFRFVRNGRNIPYQFKKRNKFHLILNLGPFWIFRLNSARNVQVSFHMFRSALEKPLNQIEPCSI